MRGCREQGPRPGCQARCGLGVCGAGRRPGPGAPPLTPAGSEKVAGPVRQRHRRRPLCGPPGGDARVSGVGVIQERQLLSPGWQDFLRAWGGGGTQEPRNGQDPSAQSQQGDSRASSSLATVRVSGTRPRHPRRGSPGSTEASGGPRGRERLPRNDRHGVALMDGLWEGNLT